MRLKKLELTGFKSFAKRTILEFPAQISAIVGPNGSGKSNVVESVRWALGEQSFKTLRGKKSEDFIFNGSATAPRLSKASVVLFFDSEKNADFAYDEAIVARRVFRDGVNEYLINNSQVRLKDVVEILSKFGLGTTSHHIISQGESDRILSSSSKERREILEDALGLKIYQLKRQEAERKLKRTEENINQIESLRKEIQPHLKFLKKQAEKVEKSIMFREKLKELCVEYFSKEHNFLKKESERLSNVKNKPQGELKDLEDKIEKLKTELAKEGKTAPVSQIAVLDKEIEASRLKRISLERDLGRCEGMIEMEEERRKRAGKEAVERPLVEKFLEKLEEYFKEGFLPSAFEKIKKAVDDFSREIKSQKQLSLASEIEVLEKKKNELVFSMEEIGEKEKILSLKLSTLKSETAEKEQSRQEAEREFYAALISAGSLRNELKSFDVEEERLKARHEEMESEKQSAAHFLGTPSISAVEPFGEINHLEKEIISFSGIEREQLRKEIERLKIRLEDSEGIGEEVLKEFNQAKARDDFFAKELDDLSKAVADLFNLMKELSEKIDGDFGKGVAEINKEFQNSFALIFGGGSAELKVVKNAKRKKESLTPDEIEGGTPTIEGADEKTEETEDGIEISVNIPRKRIRSLEMLSGGERALTSIAMMFAMVQVNPPPFLVLDEVDAALDESNSQKYAELLKNLSRRTQLILVTHNRETMKQAGVLYGVTIGSAGVSQILSVKFEEAEELAAQDKT